MLLHKVRSKNKPQLIISVPMQSFLCKPLSNKALLHFLDVATSSHLKLSARPQNISGPYYAYSLAKKIEAGDQTLTAI